MAKRIRNSDMIGKAGVALVTLRLSEMGFLFHESGSVEAGTDGFVELRDPQSGDMLSTVFRIQSKATEHGRAWRQETDMSFEFPCKDKDIDDWVYSNVPVVLVCSDTKRQVSYWKDATAYFRDAPNRVTKRVVFDKTKDVFDASAAAAIAAVAIPRGAGIYLPVAAKAEQLVTNLLEVTDHPRHVWVAPASQADMWEVDDILREAGVGVECFVRGGQLYSLRPFMEPVWAEVCEIEAAEKFDAAEWSQSDDPAKQHEFAELLRRALGEKVREHVEYDRKDKLFYFRASEDGSDVRVGGRRVYHRYPNRKTGETAFCRHSAFRAHFQRIDGRWYLELNPEYRFTRDGLRLSRFASENTSKIKKFEKNSAVRQQVQTLVNFLNQRATLLEPDYRFISFGDLLRFDVPFGFDEAEWQSRTGECPDEMQLWDVA